MKTLIAWGLRISVLLYALLHFISYFFELKILLYMLSISGLSMLAFAGFQLSIRRFKLPLFLCLTAITIMIFSETSITTGIVIGFLEMRSIIGLLIVVPIISWVLREEPYIEAVINVSHNLIDSSRKLYFGIVSFTQIIAYFLLFGAIPMLYQFIESILKHQHGEAWENFKGTALLRGFAFSTLWVVSIPSFVFAVETMNASLWIAILQGLGISVLGIIIAVIFSYFEERKFGIDLTSEIKMEVDEVLRNGSDKRVIKRRVFEFFFLFISLFGSIFLLHALFTIELMLIIPLVILLWTCIYYLLKRRTANLFKEAKIYFSKDMLNQSYQLSVMLSAGLLIFALNQTGFGIYVVNAVFDIQANFPFINFLFLLPFIVIFLGFIGLGPLTVMVLVAGILDSIALPYPPELIVITITSGSVISILLSPVIMPNIVLSGSNGLTPVQNGIKYNWKFAGLFYVIVQIYVQIMIHVW